MLEFDYDAALEPRPDVTPKCSECGGLMSFSRVAEVEGPFDASRLCAFTCSGDNCEDTLEILVSMKVLEVVAPLNERSALAAVCQGRCPHCLSLEGPEAVQGDELEDGRFELSWKCDSCENRWDEILELA